MSERQDFHPIRTDRPTRDHALLTIADVLAEPALQAGAPEVVVGGAALDAAVRWVHVSDSAGVARLLDGGELLLSTGAGWPTAAEELADFALGLSHAGVAGIVVELGSGQTRVPDAVVEVCTERGLALIALHSEVKFVAVTEAVHRALIAAQTMALRERQHLHDLFTALSLRGAPADVVVAETARALGAPVVLENMAREVIAHETLRTPVAEALGELRWTDRVPVQARGVRWGTLLALPGPAHPAGRLTVLELGATALAFGCLADDGDSEWSMLAQRGLIDDLLGARFASPDDIVARLATSGFTFLGRHCHGIVARGAESAGQLAERAAQSGFAAVSALVGDDVVALLSLPASVALSDAVVARIVGPDRTVFVGPPADDVLGLLASLRAAMGLAAGDRSDAGPRVRRVDDRPLERFVASLRDDHRLLAHSERMLAPIVAYDRERRGDLLDVLSALVAHPGNRSAAAAASHLSRSVFYQRLTVIGDLLEIDLDDGETLAALHLALLTRRSTGSAGRP
ncbi:PucR family transcriptional regulator ligand-binding domain-containing protein [Microbacterium sp. MYb62]|uniref:PucR family transcriptional regulator n=1 Tax=Microbacterium sp. MYb62 TaxID=1848690 RepID=UPI000CFB1E6C|nr:PucR family transcriptional regulator ligand-binding domain-containing protein [Microbacterium sp. MYb62]PRB16479.1 PucR family transcriptional regulator [Microbacterium sp. MYb62]